MTHTSVRWTHVLFGVGLTLVVAIAPMLFVLGPRMSADVPDQNVSGNGQSALLVASRSGLPVQPAMLLVVAAAAVVALLVTIVVSTRAERAR